MTRAFARHASDAFNAWMEERVQAIAADVRAALGDGLLALVLGGGYARGEGGVVDTPDGERPYNDLDFVVVQPRADRALGERLAPVAARHHAILGIDVDFSRPLTVEAIRAWPHYLMWTDLLGGHRVIVGDPRIITDNAPAVLRESPPLIEATRLLLNRGAGLLWSRRIREGLEPAPDADFVRRNMHKAALAMGDAFIMKHRRHQVAYEGRDALLASLGDSDAAPLLGAYREALAFRLRPGAPQPAHGTAAELAALAAEWTRVWLHIEGARRGEPFASVADYAAWGGVREPARSGLRDAPANLLRNARTGRLSLRYPRERLYRTLPALLAAPAAGTWAAESAECLALWRRYN